MVAKIHFAIPFMLSFCCKNSLVAMLHQLLTFFKTLDGGAGGAEGVLNLASIVLTLSTVYHAYHFIQTGKKLVYSMRLKRKRT